MTPGESRTKTQNTHKKRVRRSRGDFVNDTNTHDFIFDNTLSRLSLFSPSLRTRTGTTWPCDLLAELTHVCAHRSLCGSTKKKDPQLPTIRTALREGRLSHATSRELEKNARLVLDQHTRESTQSRPRAIGAAHSPEEPAARDAQLLVHDRRLLLTAHRVSLRL